MPKANPLRWVAWFPRDFGTLAVSFPAMSILDIAGNRRVVTSRGERARANHQAGAADPTETSAEHRQSNSAGGGHQRKHVARELDL